MGKSWFLITNMYILKSYLSLKSYTITNQSRDALDKPI